MCPMSHPLCEELPAWGHESWPRTHALWVFRAVVSHRASRTLVRAPTDLMEDPLRTPGCFCPCLWLPCGCCWNAACACSPGLVEPLCQALCTKPLSPEHSDHRQGPQPEVWALVSIPTPLRGSTGGWLGGLLLACVRMPRSEMPSGAAAGALCICLGLSPTSPRVLPHCSHGCWEPRTRCASAAVLGAGGRAHRNPAGSALHRPGRDLGCDVGLNKRGPCSCAHHQASSASFAGLP